MNTLSFPDLAGRQVLVVGLGRSGVAAANFLSSRKACVTATDQKGVRQLSDQLSRLDPKVDLLLEEHPVAAFLGSELIIVSPGVPLELSPLVEAQRAGVPVWGEVELAGRFLEGPIIGVTGSNGKTTTTTLIGELIATAGMPVRVAGNIGFPLIEAVDSPPKQATTVAELSSFQLETIDRFRPDIALLLNITPDHLDRHGSLEAYRAAKERIFTNQKAGDWAVLNLDDSACRQIATRVQAQLFGFSRRRPLTRGCWVDDDKVVVGDSDTADLVCAIGEIALAGSHNLENVLAAVAAGYLAGLSPRDMGRACRTFAGVEHRLEQVQTVRGVRFFNDSKATNSDAARKALEAFEEPLIVIMGGLAKEAEFKGLRAAVGRRVRRLVLLGEAARQLESDLGDLAPVSHAASLEEAVETAFAAAVPGDVVLLAPACASFDMFDNFEQRGRVFKRYVRALLEREGDE